MPKPITESVRIVIKTEDGNRACVDGKGSAVHGMHTAFMCLTHARREKLLKLMQDTHARMSKTDATPAEQAQGGEHG